ncbi:MAG TPA: hypothetical protein VFC31_16135 [Candidatus Limnocylindria bacterium]|nr:hypothetical protein [Candidatus Limnocylindria bacterium]
MLPALTPSRRRLPVRRALLGSASAALALAAVSSQVAATPAPERPVALADTLRSSSWGMDVPVAWLAAPVPSVRHGDVIDILAVRAGDRPYTVPVAYAVHVMSLDDRVLVLEVDQDDAVAIATARGAGMLLVPLLRSTR